MSVSEVDLGHVQNQDRFLHSLHTVQDLWASESVLISYWPFRPDLPKVPTKKYPGFFVLSILGGRRSVGVQVHIAFFKLHF